MGEVWKARVTRLDRLVAIKRCKHDFSDRFLREARAVAALNHPNICTLHDIGPDYLVMEYIEGSPPRGPLAAAEAVTLAAGIAAALEAAHARGIRLWIATTTTRAIERCSRGCTWPGPDVRLPGD
jgi:serine/threonine protein kinase